jgi:hypothetical protein
VKEEEEEEEEGWGGWGDAGLTHKKEDEERH